MVRKFGFLFLLTGVTLLQAMDRPDIVNFSSINPSDFVIKQTGLGETATSELMYNPEIAQAMRQMKVAEAACYAREAKKQAEKKAAEAKKNEASFGSGFGKGFLNKKTQK